MLIGCMLDESVVPAQLGQVPTLSFIAEIPAQADSDGDDSASDTGSNATQAQQPPPRPTPPHPTPPHPTPTPLLFLLLRCQVYSPFPFLFFLFFCPMVVAVV